MAKDDSLQQESSTEDSSTDPLADESWLGSEPNLLSVAEERQGVAKILQSLSDEDRSTIETTDHSMPIRYFRGEKGNVEKAVTKIQATLRWREEFEVDIIKNCFQVKGTDQDTERHEEMRTIIEKESDSGKMYIRGYDKDGRALMYMCQMRENTWNELDNMRFLVFTMEKAIACTLKKSGKQKFNQLIDFDNFQMKYSASMSTSRHTLDIMQSHYPERMCRAYILKPPLAFRVFWAMIKPFIDPVTKSKVIFCSTSGKELLDEIDDPSQLETRAYGTGTDLPEFSHLDYLQLPIDSTY